MDELLWSLAFALIASGLSFALLGRSRRTREHLQGRLGDGAEGRGAWASIVPLTDGLAGMIPGRASAREDLARELREAGYYRQTALREYLGIRAALVAIPLLIALVAGVFVPDRQIVPALGAGFGTALLAFGLPRAFVRAKGVRRRREIERALPVSVDLITLGLAAGQGLPAALARTGREIGRTFPVLAEELGITLRLADLHGLEHALASFAGRVPSNEVRNLTLILRQAERLGTDAARALTEFAADFRVTLRQRAEAQANRLSFLMLFPTIFCLLIAAGIILIGPAYFEFWQGRADAMASFAVPVEP